MAKYRFGNSVPSWNGISMLGDMPAGLTKVFFVDYANGGDGNRGDDSSKPLKTIAKAYSLLTTNKNEGIALMGSSEHVLTEMLTVAKNRVHIFGYDPGGRRYGQNARVSIGVTTDTADIAAITNTGVRNSFSNIKFSSSNTLTEGVYTFAEGGEYTVFDGCEFYLSSQLTVTGAAEMLMNGDSAQLRNCVFGSSAITLVGAIVRPCVLLTSLTISGKVARDVTFIDCEFWRKATNAANAFVWATDADDVVRKMEFRDCLFYADILSTATPDVAVGGAVALTDGRIVLTGTTSEIGCTALATQTGVWSAIPTLAAAGGSGLQAT